MTNIVDLAELNAKNKRLNIGSGTRPLQGFTNIDAYKENTPDEVIEVVGNGELVERFGENSIDTVAVSHVHFPDFHAVMGEIWRVCEDGAIVEIRGPYCGSDDAIRDGGRGYSTELFLSLGQPYYWHGYTGYDADFKIENLVFFVYPDVFDLYEPTQRWDDLYFTEITRRRNVCPEMMAVLRVVKPPRTADLQLNERPPIQIAKVQ